MAASSDFSKIKVDNPVVDILGDEMTRIIWDVSSKFLARIGAAEADCHQFISQTVGAATLAPVTRWQGLVQK